MEHLLYYSKSLVILWGKGVFMSVNKQTKRDGSGLRQYIVAPTLFLPYEKTIHNSCYNYYPCLCLWNDTCWLWQELKSAKFHFWS